jgi:hypothetical protein
VLARFAYLAVAHAFAVMRLVPMTNREKDVEILGRTSEDHRHMRA